MWKDQTWDRMTEAEEEEQENEDTHHLTCGLPVTPMLGGGRVGDTNVQDLLSETLSTYPRLLT